ncbi:MAG TPA: ribosome maturation factor RimP [Selenomonadales bacterium]|nr:ribosome maturation factor RimP [Selenomonadales bacterium]
MSGKQIENLVERLVGEVITGSDLELVDVEYVKERDWYLRVFLDKQGGLEVEDCQWVSEKLEEKLDELDPIKDSYILEVSSPGLDRPLKRDRDFVRHVGDAIEIHTFAPVNGQKMLVGKLLSLENNTIHVDVDGTEMSIPREKASQVRLHIDF